MSAAEGGDITGEPRTDADERATTRPALPLFDDAARSPDPGVCPFFRREVDGKLFAPLDEPDDGNRCVAIGGPRPQSVRQQELVCLHPAHADCPRYLRGAMLLAEPPPRTTPAVPRATLAALLVLVLSAGISFGFVVQRGGIDLPAAAAGASPTELAIVASPTPEATPSPTGAPATPSESPAPTPEATLQPHPRPDAGSDGRAHGEPDYPSDGDPAAHQRSLRPVDALHRPGGLLHVCRPGRRQPVQHRQLLRRAAGHDLRLEPEICERRRPAGGRPDPDATAHPVARDDPRPGAPANAVARGLLGCREPGPRLTSTTIPL